MKKKGRKTFRTWGKYYGQIGNGTRRARTKKSS